MNLHFLTAVALLLISTSPTDVAEPPEHNVPEWQEIADDQKRLQQMLEDGTRTSSEKELVGSYSSTTTVTTTTTVSVPLLQLYPWQYYLVGLIVLAVAAAALAVRWLIQVSRSAAKE